MSNDKKFVSCMTTEEFGLHGNLIALTFHIQNGEAMINVGKLCRSYDEAEDDIRAMQRCLPEYEFEFH